MDVTSPAATSPAATPAAVEETEVGSRPAEDGRAGAVPSDDRHDDAHEGTVPGTDAPVPVAGPDTGAVQGMLPFEGDDPIPYRLTARARRAVAPDTLPDLQVVDESSTIPPAAHGLVENGLGTPPVLEEVGDTRRARARALRRAGVALEDVAAELDVELPTVAAWTRDVSPVSSARRRLHGMRGLSPGSGEAGPGPGSATLAAVEDHDRPGSSDAHEAFEAGRRQARDEATGRLAEGAFLGGVGLVAGSASIGPHAVVVRLADPAAGAATLAWIRRFLRPDATRVRLLVRLAPQLAADRERHRWARALDLPLDRVTATRWSDAPHAAACEATLRLADPIGAARLAGWRDALLGALSGLAAPADGPNTDRSAPDPPVPVLRGGAGGP